MDNEYRKALYEVNEILKNTDKNLVKRVPKKFMDFIKENMDTKHNFCVQKNVELFEQPMKKETKIILAMIYKDYYCDSKR